MTPAYMEIRDIDPVVVDQTIHSDFPDVSVRMPIYKLNVTHATDYLELRYRKQQGQIGYTLNLSPHLLQILIDNKKAFDELPPMTPATLPFGFHLGPIEHLQDALRKLKEYHDSGKWMEFFKS